MVFPEIKVQPEIFYKNETSRGYLHSTRSIKVQSDLASRALDLTGIPDQRKPQLGIDIGCGTGLTQSGIFLKKNFSFGLDVANNMIKIISKKKEGGGIDFILIDFGKLEIPFLKKVFDFAISISVIQWVKIPKFPSLFYEKLKKFSKTIKQNGKSIIQFYPVEHYQLKNVSDFFKDIGKKSNLFIDHFHAKKKRKFYILVRN
mmetsp:Transcript_51275/g.104276  ORF Transcript_51275/g.104276 Transcript_51275/m.104276 type:complete len:202 (+) Transcript_51275:122-727(+)